MLTLKFGTLRDAFFDRGLTKMAHYPAYKNPKTSYNIAKINAKCREEMETIQGLWLKLVDQYAQKDEKGEFVPRPGTTGGTFIVPDEKAEEWKAKVVEFDLQTAEIDRPALDYYADLAAVQLTPAEIGAVEDLLVFREEQAPLAEVAPIK